MIFNKQPIAILLATYNGEKYLSIQIDSIIKQSNNDWTLYINDDGSTDNTMSIISKYTLDYPNIINISNFISPNKGPMNNFMSMLELIQSKYYMFSDQDDEWLPFKIELSLKKMIEQENLNSTIPIIVHSDVSLSDSNGHVFLDSYWKSTKCHPDRVKKADYIVFSNCVQGSTMLFNNLAKKNSLPLPNGVLKMMHDSWIAYRVLKANGVVISIYKQTMLYRQHGKNVMGVRTGNNFGIFSRLFNLKSHIYSSELDHFKTLKKIGYGSILKCIKNKCIVIYITHFKNMYL